MTASRQEWIVSISFVAPKGSPESVGFDQLMRWNALLEEMGAEFPSVGGGGNRYNATLSVNSTSCERASQIGRNIAVHSAHTVGLPAWPVTTIHALDMAGVQREIETHRMPKLVTLAGVADILDTTPAQARNATRRKGFPHPAYKFATGSLWFAAGVEAWQQRQLGTGPKPPEGWTQVS